MKSLGQPSSSNKAGCESTTHAFANPQSLLYRISNMFFNDIFKVHFLTRAGVWVAKSLMHFFLIAKPGGSNLVRDDTFTQL